MPQERGLYPDMRVIDLLVWIARLHGLDRATSRANSERLLEQLGLGDRGHDDVKDLSGGMAQRVQLAAAMVHEPDLLVLDEPFAGLDPVAIEFLSNVVREHVAAGRNVLFSSHQLDLVEDLCDTITLIHRGEVVLQGDVRQLKANSAERYLRVGVNVERVWLSAFAVEIACADVSGTRVQLEPESTRPRCSTRFVRTCESRTSRWRPRPCRSCSSRRRVSRCTQSKTRRRSAGRSRHERARADRGGEIRETMRHRTFWIVNAVLFSGALVAVVLPSVISSGSDTDVVAVVAAPPEFRAALEQARSGDDVRVRFVDVNERAAARRQVDDGDADIAVIGGEPPSIVVTAGEHPSLVGAAEQALASSEVQANLRAAGLSVDEATAVLDVRAAPIDELDEDASRVGRGPDRGNRALRAAVDPHHLCRERCRDRESEPHQRSAARDRAAASAVVRQGDRRRDHGLRDPAVRSDPDREQARARRRHAGRHGRDAPVGRGVVRARPRLLPRDRRFARGTGRTPGTSRLRDVAPDGCAHRILARLAERPGDRLGDRARVHPVQLTRRRAHPHAVGASSPLEMALSLSILVASVFVAVRVGGVVYQRAIVRTGRRLKLREVLRPRCAESRGNLVWTEDAGTTEFPLTRGGAAW